MSNKSKNVNSTQFSKANINALVVKPLEIEEKPKSNKFKTSKSDNNFKVRTGIKEKIVSRVKSWSNKDKYTVNGTYELAADLAHTQSINSPENEIVEDVVDSNLTRARGSLESLIRDGPNLHTEDLRYRACYSAAETRERTVPDSPKSSPLLQENSKSHSKFAFWDSFDKKGRKARKELNRKKKKTKPFDQPQKGASSSIPAEGKSCLNKNSTYKTNEFRDNDSRHDLLEAEPSYKYKYFPKNSKSVVFTNEVFVVYFNGNDVVCESKEPLKKDTEQQERNKEMRQGHLVKAQEKYQLCLY